MDPEEDDDKGRKSVNHYLNKKEVKYNFCIYYL